MDNASLTRIHRTVSHAGDRLKKIHLLTDILFYKRYLFLSLLSSS